MRWLRRKIRQLTRMVDSLTSFRWARGAQRILTWPFRLPAAILGGVSSLVNAGAGRRLPRQWSDLALGIPFLLVMLLAGYVTLVARADRDIFGRAAWQQGIEAIRDDDLNAAEMLLQRARQSGQLDQREIQFALAGVWQEMGLYAKSMQTFRNLAPDDREGLAKAHKHIAMIMLRDPSTMRSPERLKTWLWHLQHASDQESPEMREAWGAYYVAVDDVPAAIRAYSEAAERFPGLWLTLAELQRRTGRIEQLRITLQRASEAAKEKLDAAPDDRDSRLLYATSLLGLGELDEAERVLRTGMKIDPDGPYASLLAAVAVRIYDRMSEAEIDPDVRLAQLGQALEFEPDFAPALKRLVSFVQVSPEALGNAKEMLERSIATGEGNVAVSHLALSNLSYLAEEFEQATFHLDQAIRLDDKMPVVANNMAWILATSQPDKLDQALELIDPVVEKFPENAHFRDTRGLILLRMQRWRDALVDLEHALAELEQKRPIQARMSIAYRELGMDSLAAQAAKQAGQAAVDAELRSQSGGGETDTQP